jgi:predicted hydrolase (HD superfamily)
MTDRTAAHTLLETHISSESLRRHCQMVAWAMEGYAQKLGANTDEWYVAGLLHDLDWESHPDEHPNYALTNLLPQAGLTESQLHAIAAHAPERTGKQPLEPMDLYLFACDELSGFIDAIAKIRPNKFADLEWSSVKKKFKDKAFAAAVSRDDMTHGADLIGLPMADHATNLIQFFRAQA